MYRVGAIADIIGQHVKRGSKPGSKNAESCDVRGKTPLYVDYTPSEPTARKRRKREKEHFNTKKPKTELEQKKYEDSCGHDVSESVQELKGDENDSDDVPTRRPRKPTRNVDDEVHVQDTPERRARTIFVGNLPAATSKKELKRLFSKYGAIEGLRFRSIAPAREKFSKKVAAINRKLINENKKTVNAYIVFKETKSANDALEANATTVATNHICVDKVDGKRQVDSSKSVFIGNLPLHTTDEELWECFSQCGKVRSVRIVRDSNTGMGKGFGFVSFNGLDAVALALEMNGTEIAERHIRVMPVEKKKSRVNKVGKGKKKTQDAEGLTDFHGARAERLQRKKKLKKVIQAKKKERKAKLLFGFKKRTEN
ncbi:RNA-binding protein 34-like [Ornithodoros turicata]|uniref:RNA-binding protein 34-like n=1 Tax=Ornithodoros turicata TaxID=34597 RepID=UPI003139816A